MGLNASNGNMYTWVTHTWNTVKGECPHGCTYCYMKRFGKQKPVHFDEGELKTDLGSGNFIFVGSSCDLFAHNIDEEWIEKTLHYITSYPNNTYLFQSKNPARIAWYQYCGYFTPLSVFCTTLETNRSYEAIRHNAPAPIVRYEYMNRLSKIAKTYITIEPIMDFDLDDFVSMIKYCNPTQVNIGADSGSNHLPEPSKDKILALIEELQKFTTIDQKRNLSRLLK